MTSVYRVVVTVAHNVITFEPCKLAQYFSRSRISFAHGSSGEQSAVRGEIMRDIWLFRIVDVIAQILVDPIFYLFIIAHSAQLQIAHDLL